MAHTGMEPDGYLPEDTELQNIQDMVRRSRNHPSVILRAPGSSNLLRQRGMGMGMGMGGLACV